MCEVFLTAAEWAEVLADARRLWPDLPLAERAPEPWPDAQSD